MGGTTLTALRNLTFINVKDYRAQGDGVTDDTSFIQAAINVAQTAGGGVVSFPAGIYKITTPLTITSKNVVLLGTGVASAILLAGTFSGAAAIIITGGSDQQIRDLYFKGNSTTYTSNPAADAIQVNHATGFIIQNVQFHYINGWCVELVNDATGTCSFPSLISVHVNSDCKAGIHILGDFADGNYNSGAYIANCDLGGTQNGDGLCIEDIHDVTITNLEGGTAGGGNTIHIVGACSSVYVSNFDLGTLVGGAVTANPTVLIESNANGTPDQVAFIGGILETGVYNASITAGTNINFSTVRFFKGGTYGVNITGAADKITLTDCAFIQNGFTAGSANYDINCTASGKVKVTGCTFTTPQGTGISQVARACNFTTGIADVLNCSFLGPTGSSAFAGAPSKTRGNRGYNPVGAITPPAVPASGVASGTFSSDMTVYVTGGTVTVIAVGGTTTGLTSGAFRIPAGLTITITYSVAPTWTWFGD